jgi:hypothetical protein
MAHDSRAYNRKQLREWAGHQSGHRFAALGILELLDEVEIDLDLKIVQMFKEILHRLDDGLIIVPAIGIPFEQKTPVEVSPSPHPFVPYRKILMAQQTDSQTSSLGPLQFTDKKGNPVAAPAGITVAWSVDNPNLMTLTPSADGLSCDAASVGPLGTATVSVAVSDASGNAVAGGSVGIDIISGAPTKVVIPVGPAVEQP